MTEKEDAVHTRPKLPNVFIYMFDYTCWKSNAIILKQFYIADKLTKLYSCIL